MRPLLHTKIVATIGPASHDLDVLARLIEAGMSVARLNFSHGTHAFHAENIERIRQVSTKMGVPVAILADLQGPKLRVARIEGKGMWLQKGTVVTLTTKPLTGRDGVIPVQFSGLPQAVAPGDRILIDDGAIELEVIHCTDKEVKAQVRVGGLVTSYKGLNLPDSSLSLSAITEKDRQDLQFALAHGVDWVALSFVRTAQEIHNLKELIKQFAHGEQQVPVIAKIEKPQALEHLDDIIDAADGIMVARGDLAVETSPEDVPIIQKRIIRKCNEAGKPVITATQMLESMVYNPRPTRAEVSDVANAILDGSDAVMLSAETASGKYPVESVRMMARIIARVEEELHRSLPRLHPTRNPGHVEQAVARAAVLTASDLGARLIITPTLSGNTARQVSRFRPPQPIIAPTPNPVVQHQILLHWGVFPFLAPRQQNTDDMLAQAVDLALDEGLARPGDTVVLVAGAAGSPPGSTDFMKVEVIRRVLARGRGIGDRSVMGYIMRVTTPSGPDQQLPQNAIVVLRSIDLATAATLASAAGLIVEQPLDPVQADFLQQLGVPAVVDVGDASQRLPEGQPVLLDARRGIIYEG